MQVIAARMHGNSSLEARGPALIGDFFLARLSAPDSAVCRVCWSRLGIGLGGPVVTVRVILLEQRLSLADR
jgi:hypothetical protein